jgi:hypothetical protein
MSERVNQPTAYSLVLEIFGIGTLYAGAREYSYYKSVARLEGDSSPSCGIGFPDHKTLLKKPKITPPKKESV